MWLLERSSQFAKATEVEALKPTAEKKTLDVSVRMIPLFLKQLA
jgi:hypothetical protein